jgi:hypothetical protein
MTQTHELKTWPEFFEEVRNGNKPFEYRLNDRDYKVGDVLHLREWVPPTDEQAFDAPKAETPEYDAWAEKFYTGRDLWKRVSYVLEPTRFGPTGKQIKHDMVVLGLAPFHVGADVNPQPWIPMSNPTDIKVLGKALEEAGEVISAMARCLIQGIDETEPSTGVLNREWLTKEIADAACTSGLVARHFDLNMSAINTRIAIKQNHLQKWFAMLDGNSG